MTARDPEKAGPGTHANGGGAFPPPDSHEAIPGAPKRDGGAFQPKGKLGAVRYTFAPLPPRCLRDSRLTAEHYRVLGIIARHDGMGRNGTGCYARDRTLAAEIALPESTVKTRITELIAMEYVHERPSERHAGVLHRRVMYTDEDRGVMRSRRARPGVAADLPAVVARALRSTVR